MAPALRDDIPKVFSGSTSKKVNGVDAEHPLSLLQYGRQFGYDRFHDPENTASMQDGRMQSLVSVQRNERIDGRQKRAIDCFDVFTARAEMKLLKAGGADMLVAECFKTLPFAVTVKAWRLFDKQFGNPTCMTPDSWESMPQ